MGKQPQVVLLGDSVLMDSVANSLIDRQFLDVVRITKETSEFNQLTDSLLPDLIVYEYDTKITDLVHSLLSKQIDSLLLVIDPYFSQVIVLDCHLRPAQSMQELCELIKEEVQRFAQRKEVD